MIVKICGITSLHDARLAVDAGADALGFVFCPSPRRVSPGKVRAIVAELPSSILTVGVFLDDPTERVRAVASESGVGAVQLHGNEPADDCALLAQDIARSGKPRHVIKRFDIRADDDAATLQTRMEPYDVAAHLLDPGAGSGQAFDWPLARDLPGRVIIAGGLNPDNVAEAIEAARPYGVDVCSGVEQSPGLKCPESVRAFIDAVRTVRNPDVS
jgi:phosphoribosylanthranilate isomerase